MATCIAQGAARHAASTTSPARSMVADNGSTDGSRGDRGRRGGANGGGRGARLRQRADGRHRVGAGSLRADGRCGRQLRLPRAAEIRHQAARGVRPGPGVPPRARRRGGHAGRDAVPAPLAGAIPMFSTLSRSWFHAPINDVYCGMRGFTKDHYESLDQRCTGHGVRDGDDHQVESPLGDASPRCRSRCTRTDARAHTPHLRTFRDGWRTLRFFLMFSPRWLFLVPGLALVAVRAAGLRAGAARRCTIVRGHLRRAHASLRAACALLCGFQSIIVRRVHEGLRDQRRPVATGWHAIERTYRLPHARERARGSVWWRWRPGLALLLRRHQLVARRRFRAARLRQHDARWWYRA